MERKITKTGDGSSTIYIPELDEHYHSVRGAIQEADHVYLEMGLRHFLKENQVTNISVLEIGFGTGLNALMTFLEAEKAKIQIDYTTLEAYPVSSEEVSQLNYAAFFPEYAERIFSKLHSVPWEVRTPLSDLFQIKKEKKYFSEVVSEEEFHLIYFDAFAPKVQPELWTPEIFKKMYNSLMNNGILVTYSASGKVRRAMTEVGFRVERLPGPPGKWEMLRGKKESI